MNKLREWNKNLNANFRQHVRFYKACFQVKYKDKNHHFASADKDNKWEMCLRTNLGLTQQKREDVTKRLTCNLAISSPNFFCCLARMDWWYSALACMMHCFAARVGNTSWK